MQSKESLLDLQPFATTRRQKEVLSAVIDAEGDREAAAERLGVSRRLLRQALHRIKLNAASGNSMLYKTEDDPDGKLLHWVKLPPNLQAQLAAIEEVLDEGVQDVKPRPPLGKRLGDVAEELMQLYPEGDPHWGMRVWGPETDGTNYDLQIAYEEYITAIDYLVDVAPPAIEAISLNIGDNFHSDNPENQTRRSGHNLNVDGRLAKVFDTVQRARVYKIEKMLEKHQKVIVVEIPGNHDDVMSMAFRKTLSAYYRNEPRVEIADLGNPRQPANTFWYHRFGKVLLGATHGDKVKPVDLPILMATDRPDLWGPTEVRHCFIGHFHHKQVHRVVGKDHVGATVEMLRTIAPGNEFEHGHGYRARREMWARTYHAEHGELFTNHIGGSALQYLNGDEKWPKTEMSTPSNRRR